VASGLLQGGRAAPIRFILHPPPATRIRHPSSVILQPSAFSLSPSSFLHPRERTVRMYISINDMKNPHAKISTPPASRRCHPNSYIPIGIVRDCQSPSLSLALSLLALSPPSPTSNALRLHPRPSVAIPVASMPSCFYAQSSTPNSFCVPSCPFVANSRPPKSAPSAKSVDSSHGRPRATSGDLRIAQGWLAAPKLRTRTQYSERIGGLPHHSLTHNS